MPSHTNSVHASSCNSYCYTRKKASFGGLNSIRLMASYLFWRRPTKWFKIIWDGLLTGCWLLLQTLLAGFPPAPLGSFFLFTTNSCLQYPCRACVLSQACGQIKLLFLLGFSFWIELFGLVQQWQTDFGVDSNFDLLLVYAQWGGLRQPGLFLFLPNNFPRVSFKLSTCLVS